MPRVPGISEPVLRQLEAELRHAPRETLLKDVERIEEIAPLIDRTLGYPEDWIVHRITGYRPNISTPRVVDGASLLRDLSPFCERLCTLASHTRDELEPGRFVRLTELRERWRLSEITLKRLRRAGLVSRRVLNTQGRHEVWVNVQQAEAFLRTRGGPPRAMPRRSAQTRARLLREAARYQRRLGWSLHRIAERLAQRHGGSVEGMRQLLARAQSSTTTFTIRSRITARRRLAMLRLHLRGVAASSIARIDARSTVAVRRELNLARARLLRTWLEPFFTNKSTHADAQRHERTLSLVTPPSGVLHDAILTQNPEDWRHSRALDKEEEHALSRAFHSAIWLACRLTSALHPQQPRAADLDRAETLLRLADQLRARLVASQLRLVLETCESRAGTALSRMPDTLAARLTREALRATGEAVGHYDPDRGGRLAGPVALAVDRASIRVLREAGWNAGATARRAEPIRAASLMQPITWSAWSRWLDAPAFVHHSVRAGALDARAARVLCARFGLVGPPRSIADIARLEHISHAACARLVLSCLRDAYRRSRPRGAEVAPS